ncbi:MAG: hypothetical protein JNL28_00855 [Planctomycetes bacterium]|nr:hypothetical protein [Planctomycetota bacterium]
MQIPTHVRFVFTALVLGLVALGSACGSTASSTGVEKREKTGHPLRVRYIAYASGQRLELVNDSHSDRTETYSSTKKLEEAFVKVATDEVLDETLVQFKSLGYFDHAAPGSAPTGTQAGISQAFEVEQGGRTTSWALQKTAGPEEAQRFGQCFKLFYTVYNNTFGLQSVERAPDWQNENASLKKKRNP